MMFRKLWLWFKTRKTIIGIQVDVEDSNKRIATLASDKRDLILVIDDLKDNFKEAANKAERLVNRFENEMEEMRERLRLADEVTIPALVENVKRFQEMWRAEADIQVQRQVATHIERD